MLRQKNQSSRSSLSDRPIASSNKKNCDASSIKILDYVVDVSFSAFQARSEKQEENSDVINSTEFGGGGSLVLCEDGGYI